MLPAVDRQDGDLVRVADRARRAPDLRSTELADGRSEAEMRTIHGMASGANVEAVLEGWQVRVSPVSGQGRYTSWGQGTGQQESREGLLLPVANE